MSTITKEFTKEQLIEQAKKNIEVLRGAAERIPGASDAAVIHLKLAEITLASLEAEADAACQHQWKFSGANKLQRQKQCVKCGRVELVAPPAPVAPDLKELEAILDWILMLPCPTPKATHFAKRLAVVIDACRAAMLQGAENAESRCTIQTAPALDSSPKNAESRCSNSTVIPDGICHYCGRKPLKNKMCSVAGCDGKHVARGFCVKHYAIERKKDPSRRESIRAADKRYRARKAAAPQQEVK